MKPIQPQWCSISEQWSLRCFVHIIWRLIQILIVTVVAFSQSGCWIYSVGSGHTDQVSMTNHYYGSIMHMKTAGEHIREKEDVKTTKMTILIHIIWRTKTRLDLLFFTRFQLLSGLRATQYRGLLNDLGDTHVWGGCRKWILQRMILA